MKLILRGKKLNYIHQNPVKDKIVEKAEDYLYSSERNYADLEYELEIYIFQNN